jgi:hypothetical protein
MKHAGLLELMESRSDEMNIDINLPGEEIRVNALDELRIDPTDLDTEFMAIPGQIAYWTAVAARCQAVLEATKRNFDRWYIPLYEEEFQTIHQSTGKKPNISSAENRVKLHYSDDYEKFRTVLDSIEVDLQVINGMIEALEAKLQALIQLAKRQYVEYDRVDASLTVDGVLSPRRRASGQQEAAVVTAEQMFRQMRRGSAGEEEVR